MEALRSQVAERAVLLRSFMREERGGALRAYRCLVLFSGADGDGAGGVTTLDLDPARFESLERLDRHRDVGEAFARVFGLATGGISMMSKG